MQTFDVKEWRRIYDKVQHLGQIIKDSNQRLDDEGNWLPALHLISVDARKSIEAEIKVWLAANDNYLDACGMKPNPPLWKYDVKDPTTWASHATFKYKHLMNSKGNNRCTNGGQRLPRYA